jgi:hypothetical protein
MLRAHYSPSREQPALPIRAPEDHVAASRCSPVWPLRKPAAKIVAQSDKVQQRWEDAALWLMIADYSIQFPSRVFRPEFSIWEIDRCR